MTVVLRTLYRTFGARGIALRVAHELRRRARLFAPAPRRAPGALVAPPPAWPFTIDAAAIAAATDHALAIERADRVAAGEYQAFGRAWLPLPSAPDEWARHPHTGHRYPDAAWWTVPLLGSAGDVKDVWEPARFGWVYDLVRGHAVTGDERYAEAFWRTLESFDAGCPPMRGVQWACGQETAIRAVALLWAEAAFAGATTTAERRTLLQRLLHASGERIADAIGYAVSQRNNHAISEAVGLVALGARFASGSPAAAAWYRRGRALLPRLVDDQVASDGWYIQHSFTYARLALDMLVTGLRVLGSAGDRLPRGARDRVASAARLLALVTDPDTGDVPNHGPNDGAHVLPLGLGGYRDFRPAVTAICATIDLPLPAPLQPSREALAWLGAEIRRDGAGPAGDRVVTGTSGWVFAQRGAVRVFARAGSYAGRPGHMDPLHVDIRVGSRPVAIDAGTFRYNAPPPWGHALEDTRVHNTVTIPQYPVARRGPRFLWLSTPSAAVESVEEGDATTTIRLTHRSWLPVGIRHRRTIEVARDRVVVLDELARQGADTAFEAELHWLCDVSAHSRPAVTATPAGTLHERSGEETDVRGWHSLHYGTRDPARSLTCAARAREGRLEFRTVFDLSPDLPSTHD